MTIPYSEAPSARLDFRDIFCGGSVLGVAINLDSQEGCSPTCWGRSESCSVFVDMGRHPDGNVVLGIAVRRGKMKKLLFIMGLWIVIGFCVAFEATTYILDEATLDQLIKKTESEATSDRVLGFNAIATFLDTGQHVSAGFSDIQPETSATKTKKPSITDVKLKKNCAGH